MPRRIETLAAHAGRRERTPGQPVTPSISVSTTYHLPAPGEYEGHGYSRLGNSSREGLEATLAALEGGDGASAFSSGCAAMHAVLQMLRPGDHLVACADIYGGTYRLIEQIIRPLGIEVAWVDMGDVEAVGRSFQPNTKMLWIETPTNPLLRVFDIEALAAMARARSALSVVDGTFSTPFVQQPLALGADLVVHSMSKYLNGHSDVVAGAVIASRAELSEPVRFMQQSGGAVLGPFDAYLVARGIKTLPLRMARHCENAQALAEWLLGHPSVAAVHYPGLSGHPEHALAQKQMRGFGGMLSFEIEGGLAAARTFFDRVRLFSLAESLGGVESLVGQPALMSHASMPTDVRRARGIADGLVRVSVGLEHVDDLREDLAQALGTS